jgi:hypothetical protein
MDVHILSGGLTVVTILIAIFVMVKWQSATKDALFKKTELESVQWLIVGVWFAFLGQTVDNIYWLIAWTSHHFSNHGALTVWLFENGISFNIPFRQALGIFAAYCHLKAAQSIVSAGEFKLNKILILCCGAGAIFSGWMIFEGL